MIYKGEVLSFFLGRYEGNLPMVIIHWPRVPFGTNLHWSLWRNDKIQHFAYKPSSHGPDLEPLKSEIIRVHTV